MLWYHFKSHNGRTKIVDPAPAVGAFISNLSGLNPNTLYYVRAYAINSIGTTYGTQISFYALPMVTTSPVINITPATASSGGNVTSTVLLRHVASAGAHPPGQLRHSPPKRTTERLPVHLPAA